MKQLLIRPCEEGVRSWMGGDLLSYNMLIVWSSSGCGYLYQIEPQLVFVTLVVLLFIFIVLFPVYYLVYRTLFVKVTYSILIHTLYS